MGLEGQYFLPAQSVPHCPSNPSFLLPLSPCSMAAMCRVLAHLAFHLAFCHIQPLTCQWRAPSVLLSALRRKQAEGWRHLPWCHGVHRLWGVCGERADPPRKEPPYLSLRMVTQGHHDTNCHSSLRTGDLKCRSQDGVRDRGCSATGREHRGFVGASGKTALLPQSSMPPSELPCVLAPHQREGKACPPTSLILQMSGICPVRAPNSSRHLDKSSKGHPLVVSRPEAWLPSV